MSRTDEYNKLLNSVINREFELACLSPSEKSPSSEKSPYVFFTFGCRGSGKSSFLNSMAQVIRDSDVLENIATSCKTNDQGYEGTYHPVLYQIKKKYLYIMDLPGIDIRRPRENEIDLKTAQETLTKQIGETRTNCRAYPGLGRAIPGEYQFYKCDIVSVLIFFPQLSQFLYVMQGFGMRELKLTSKISKGC